MPCATTRPCSEELVAVLPCPPRLRGILGQVSSTLSGSCGPIPQMALDRAFDPRKPALGALAPKPAGVVNAPVLLVELMDKSAGFSDQAELHVINLTLLPHTEPDLEWLDTALGQGSVEILSRGYGDCRISATGQAHVWRVQFFNSMDVLILDTFEVTRLPEVALAAPEDLADSAERIREVMEAIR